MQCLGVDRHDEKRHRSQGKVRTLDIRRQMTSSTNLARHVASVGSAANLPALASANPNAGCNTCALCGDQIPQGCPVFMCQDRAFCSAKHRVKSYSNERTPSQHQRSQRTTSKSECAMEAAQSSASDGGILSANVHEVVSKWVLLSLIHI